MQSLTEIERILNRSQKAIFSFVWMDETCRIAFKSEEELAKDKRITSWPAHLQRFMLLDDEDDEDEDEDDDNTESDREEKIADNHVLAQPLDTSTPKKA